MGRGEQLGKDENAAREAMAWDAGDERTNVNAPGLGWRLFEKLMFGFAEGLGIIVALLAGAGVLQWVLR